MIEGERNVISLCSKNSLRNVSVSYTHLDVYKRQHITRELVEEVLTHFIGTIEQVPPAFSACMVDGKRAYELERKGEEVELKAKQLVIDEIELLECRLEEPEPMIRIRRCV